MLFSCVDRFWLMGDLLRLGVWVCGRVCRLRYSLLGKCGLGGCRVVLGSTGGSRRCSEPIFKSEVDGEVTVVVELRNEGWLGPHFEKASRPWIESEI